MATSRRTREWIIVESAGKKGIVLENSLKLMFKGQRLSMGLLLQLLASAGSFKSMLKVWGKDKYMMANSLFGL